MIRYSDIVKEPNKVLKSVAKEVKLPLTQKTIKKISEMQEYLITSQSELGSLENNLRPGVGIAAPQVGISERYFYMYFNDGNMQYDEVIINPKILKTSNQQIYLEKGEGCLSVEEDKKGLVLRFEKIEAEYYTIEGKKKNAVFTGYAAIVFQHEYDHLEGIMFYEKIAGPMHIKALEQAKKI